MAGVDKGTSCKGKGIAQSPFYSFYSDDSDHWA